MTPFLISLITQIALIHNIPPKLALSVAIVESKGNSELVGNAGEIGLFQIMPEHIRKHHLNTLIARDPLINIELGMELLEEAKRGCKHQTDYTYVVCYNLGAKKAERVKHPKQWGYYLAVMKEFRK